MALNKQKGNMYGFVTHTWNPIKGRCSHGCKYCYMKPFWKSDVHLDEEDLKTDLGEGNFIFVGSSTDMFAKEVPEEWIDRVLSVCLCNPKNRYLFQSKDIERLGLGFGDKLPKNCVIATTLETNRENDFSGGNPIKNKVSAMKIINGKEKLVTIKGVDKMVTIEPIMDFDLKEFVEMINEMNPKWVNIGADSKGHKLPEPSSEKIGLLIKELEKFTKVNLKDNLKRLFIKEKD